MELRAGGYVTAPCGRPKGHEGNHRKRATAADWVLFYLRNDWVIWKPAGERVAYACAGGDTPAKRVSLALLNRLEREGVLTSVCNETGTPGHADTEWRAS